MSDRVKQKVKFLTVVWGPSYIRRFCELSLPSFVAPGNIPALAEGRDFEVVIMTRSSDFAQFDLYPAMARLRETCMVRFVAIDDLMDSSVYGVTLTLAYARPIIAMGEEMLDTQFVFMNADFLLADGSLRGLAERIDAGEAVILGPSFRAICEEMEPLLAKQVNHETGTLCIPPRTMTGLAMQSIHPTKLAKIQNQNFLHSRHPNQVFWRVNHETLVGHYFLVFMLSIKPSRVLRSVSAYCDYSFIPDLCPSANETMMGDSDDFFMLELQEAEQESQLLRAGSPYSAKQVARTISRWATREHLRAARHPVVFHSAEFPPETKDYLRKASNFVAEVIAGIPRPVEHATHWHWLYGVEAWREQRKEELVHALPPELALPGPSPNLWRYRAKAKLRSLVLPQKRYALPSVERTLAKITVDRLPSADVEGWVQFSPTAPEPTLLLLERFPQARFPPIRTVFKKLRQQSLRRQLRRTFVVSVGSFDVLKLLRKLTGRSLECHWDRVVIFATGELEPSGFYRAILAMERRGIRCSVTTVGGPISWRVALWDYQANDLPTRVKRFIVFFPRLLLKLLAVCTTENVPVEGLRHRMRAAIIDLRRA